MLRINLPRLALLSLLVGSFATFPDASRAATIALEAGSPSVVSGGLVEIRIYGSDFVDGTDGGDFALDWPSSLSFVSLAIENPPWDLSDFDAAGAATGSISFVDVFSFVDTPGVGGGRFEIATLTLLAESPGTAAVTIGFAQVGWSLAGVDLDVAYGSPASIQILAVPEPSAATLVALGLSMLGCSRRRLTSEGNVVEKLRIGRALEIVSA